MRLIDADAMHKFVYDKVAEGKDGWANGVPYEWAYALTAVDMQPTIDAEPVRHGKWMYHRLSVPKGKGQTYSVYGCWLCHAHVRKRTPYCPYCGAKMQGGNDEAL